MNKHDVIIRAVNELKDSEYGATAIKVELEVQANRVEDDFSTKQIILEALEPLGLSEHDSTKWIIKSPLKYAKVYNDGSVDTELTFTLMLDNSENILLLPKIIEAFQNSIELWGDSDFGINSAGMHLALLNNADATYPAKQKPYDIARFKNFRKSMIRLLPALYFLGSHDKRSRELRFRQPQIQHCNTNTHGVYTEGSSKYSAVAFRGGSVEFRVFETCYYNPDAILDYIVVMANAMRFWTRKYTRNYLKRIPKPVRFGLDSGDSLARLYYTQDHMNLLHDGLAILKPSYYTINELKKQREFTVTKKSINTKLKQVKLDAVKNYKQYEKRFSWEVIFREQDHIRRVLSDYSQGYLNVNDDKAKVLARLHKQARLEAKRHKANKRKQRDYISEAVENSIPSRGGTYVLDEESL